MIGSLNPLQMNENDASTSAESSLDLLARARSGDRAALDVLMARHLPRLRRWASGRLPRWARDVADTQDLVQETLFQTFKGIDRFEVRGDGALQAYLRQGVLNRIRDEFRRAGRRPTNEALDSQTPHGGPSPLDEAIGSEAVERYEKALERLRAEDREAIVARIEMGFTHEELAKLLGKPSANTARMAVERALVRLAAEMRTLEAPRSKVDPPE
jgi:RNA polymerase sigma-70 factor (ECF subfamily)